MVFSIQEVRFSIQRLEASTQASSSQNYSGSPFHLYRDYTELRPARELAPGKTRRPLDGGSIAQTGVIPGRFGWSLVFGVCAQLSTSARAGWFGLFGFCLKLPETA